MRIGIISDVHSNLPALEAVTAFLRRQDVEKIIHAGDIVGYNAFPNEALRVFWERNILSILGNHDCGAIGRENISAFNPAAKVAMQWTAASLGEQERKYLGCLARRIKERIGGRRVCVIHGHPDDDIRYTYAGEAAEPLLERTVSEILILGHTHEPFIRRFESGVIINPGSVGQPRDGDWRASCAVMDTYTLRAQVHRLEYPVKKTQEANRAAGLPEALSERLSLGR